MAVLAGDCVGLFAHSRWSAALRNDDSANGSVDHQADRGTP
jgi:hypothetical protein